MEEVNGVISQVPHHILNEIFGFSGVKLCFLVDSYVISLDGSVVDMEKAMTHSSLGVSLTSYAIARGFSWGGFVEFSQALVFWLRC